ncbi:Uu.00g072840.m01.CDS01 [Anthostomella pinea]|uniref:Uu.00g072840.m01.CDS01 n=1 Tax=Anthostomella pinea TaxID=933095 RepID=A0AAI8YNS3_9PEZI|nr:Uu.00g072840.m01.CDS01 [Anthostomella pinea]
MAATESAQQTSLATNRATRQSPQPQQSKRDKKRQVMNDRLNTLAEQFSRDKDRQYREELHKIQVDVNLVGHFDPYVDRPLDGIDCLCEQSQANGASNANANTNNRSLLYMAGPTTEDWTRTVEDHLETRDYDMTTQKYDFERKMQDYHNTHAYRVEVAKREHRALSATLKDRLINNILSKKYRLGKEKEAIEISDSSALLLHPNQFSLTNPASPGGTHGKRNTRLRREMEELPGYSENKKRKRNAADDDGSPAPVRRALDPTNTTPFWQSDRLRGLRKETGPVYSIDKLFTDKELSLTYNTAAIAAHKHLLTRRDVNGNVLPSPEESDAGNGEANEDEEDPSAATMERQPSHATRSTRGGHNHQNFYDNKILGIEGLANFQISGNLDKMASQEPKLPPLIHSQYSKAYIKSESNTPIGLTPDDALHDLTVMGLYKSIQSQTGVGSNMDVANGGRRLLEAMAQPQRRSNYATYVQGPRPSTDALSEGLGFPSSSARDEPNGAGPANHAHGVAPFNAAAAGVPMSRQSSLGGVAMSRTGSARGKRKA